MGKIVTNAIKKTYKNLVKQVIKDLGESIQLYYAPVETACPNCYWDPVNKQSKNVYNSSFIAPVVIYDVTINPQSFTRGRCPVCKGAGILYSFTPIVVKALVKWSPEDSEMEYSVAGKEGMNIVRVKARKTYYVKIRDCNYAMIDGVKCELLKPPVFRGLGKDDEMVVAFFGSVEPGKSVKE